MILSIPKVKKNFKRKNLKDVYNFTTKNDVKCGTTGATT